MKNALCLNDRNVFFLILENCNKLAIFLKKARIARTNIHIKYYLS